jgi:hypothetical protein
MEHIFLFRDNKIDLTYLVQNKYSIFNYQDISFSFLLKDYYIIINSSCPEDQDSVYLTFDMMCINNEESNDQNRFVINNRINALNHPIFGQFQIIQKMYSNNSFRGSTHVRTAEEFVSCVTEFLKIITKAEGLKAFI